MNHETVTEPNRVTFNCLDSAADGWHGGYLEVANTTICGEFEKGSAWTMTCDVAADDVTCGAEDYPECEEGFYAVYATVAACPCRALVLCGT